MLFQCIEDTWSLSVFVSGIKSEVDFFLIGIFSIVGMILAKIVDSVIHDREFSLIWKLRPQLVDSDKREADAA